MADNDTRTLPVFPSVIFIVAPIIGITGLLCWATIENRRGYGIRRHLNRQRAEANAKALSIEDAPSIYEVWLQYDAKGTTEHHGEGKIIAYSNEAGSGDVGDGQPFHLFMQRPLALQHMGSKQTSDTVEADELATLIRMPMEVGPSNLEKGGNGLGAEILIGTSSFRITNPRDPSRQPI